MVGLITDRVCGWVVWATLGWGSGPCLPAKACGPGWGHKNTVLTLFSEPRQAGCHHSGLRLEASPEAEGKCHDLWHPALPSHRCPCPRVWEEGLLGGEQEVGGVSGRGQSSRESWDTCPSNSLCMLLTLPLSGVGSAQ